MELSIYSKLTRTTDVLSDSLCQDSGSHYDINKHNKPPRSPASGISASLRQAVVYSGEGE